MSGGPPPAPGAVAATSLLEGLRTTRAIRRFRPAEVPEDDLATILFTATRAPSGSNRQPFRFLVLRATPAATEAKALLGRSFRAQWAEKRRADGYDRGSGADRSSAKARMAASMQQFVDRFEEIPVVVLAALEGRRSAAEGEAEVTPRSSLHDGASVYPACQNLLLAARALGYGGVITMWHAEVERELREALGIPGHVVLAATIPLGRPEGGHGPVRRRPVAELVFEDRWGSPAAWAHDPPGTRFTSAGPAR